MIGLIQLKPPGIVQIYCDECGFRLGAGIDAKGNIAVCPCHHCAEADYSRGWLGRMAVDQRIEKKKEEILNGYRKRDSRCDAAT